MKPYCDEAGVTIYNARCEDVLPLLDPYMGSGPVAQACSELGRRYIGVECVEDYCAAAVGRLAQGALDFGGAA